MKKLSLLMILIGLSNYCIFSQAIDISQDEFYSQFRKANQKPTESKRRKNKSEEFAKNGGILSTVETITEYISSDKLREIELTKKGKKVSKFEMIQIGESYYCKKDNGIWIKSDERRCGEGGLSALPNPITSKITAEESELGSQSVTLYQQYLTYATFTFSEKTQKAKYFYKERFWVNNKGYLLRREKETGELKTIRTNYREITIYEYNPKDIKPIEAPIK
jgi:hypothetical protein